MMNEHPFLNCNSFHTRLNNYYKVCNYKKKENKEKKRRERLIKNIAEIKRQFTLHLNQFQYVKSKHSPHQQFQSCMKMKIIDIHILLNLGMVVENPCNLQK